MIKIINKVPIKVIDECKKRLIKIGGFRDNKTTILYIKMLINEHIKFIESLGGKVIWKEK